MDEQASPELLRELGKSYFFNSKSDEETKKFGLKLILEAHTKRDPEAAFIVARLLIDNVLKPVSGDSIEQALMLMCSSANDGCIQARAFLNAYCEQRYSDEYEGRFEVGKNQSELLDFEGKPIRINRQGIFTPIDAVLERKGEHNVLTLSANLMFNYIDKIDNAELFEQAVINGIMAWQGEYTVFGGQQLSVEVKLTRDEKLFDNLYIMPVTDSFSSTIQAVGKVIGGKERKARISSILTDKRSFAGSGLKWTSKSRKIICIQSDDGKFDDYDEIKNVSKHEFGHTLGLGDLYSSRVDLLEGVKKGTYLELDSYAISDKYYNLVMCDHNGPISNNDIEMVVLAFRENREQLYQLTNFKGKISSALGKGN